MATVQLISGQLVEGAKLINISPPDEEGSRSATAIIDGREYPVYNSIIDGFNNIWNEQMDWETYKKLGKRGFVEGSIMPVEEDEESEGAWGERKDKDALEAAKEHVVSVYTTYTRNTTEQWELDVSDAAKLRYNDSPGRQDGYLIVNSVSSRVLEYKSDADGEVWEIEAVVDVGCLLDPEVYRVYLGISGDWIVEQ